MGFSISEIIAHLNRNYIAKPYLYEVRIYGVQQNIPDASPDIMFNCAAVNVPGINVGFTQVRKYTIGLPKNFPMSKSFTELNLTFYESEFEKERQYFVDWMDKIYDRQTGRFSFYNDLVKNLNIIQYNRKGEKTYECMMLECFPSNLSPLDKGYAAGDSVPQFNVNMQFHDVREIFYDKVLGRALF